MSKIETKKIRFSTLENPVENNWFALLRLLISIVGKENSKAILDLISNNTQEDDNKAKTIFYSILKDKYPSLKSLTQEQIENKIIELYKQADVIISRLVNDIYENMEFELSLLNSTSISVPDPIFKTKQYLLNGESTTRYKYELLRQDILALLLFELEELNHERENRKQLNGIQQILEKLLFLGKTGDLKEKIFYSVHSNQDNHCLVSFDSKKAAIEYSNKTKDTHVKKHSWRTRRIRGIGKVLSTMRVKSQYSIIRKAIFKNEIKKSKIKSIDLHVHDALIDKTGFMFVTPNGMRDKLMAQIITQLEKVYPNFKYKYKNKVGTTGNRKQSNKVNFARIIAYTLENSQPIEIIVMNQDDYLNYRFELEQAHEIFDVNKSSAATKLLFPEQIYNRKKMEKAKEKKRKKVIKELLKKQKIDNPK